ncbi:unnamed protein product [Lupinus luteus]|uniref:UBZ4-type domain-containing protein n=1 Tax=Lupinus luteus TaxID=3873 RepID=A0AAV1X4D2_LUPLU
MSNGFSIRDYTYKMRSIDVFNSWPFSTSHHLHSSLPPISQSLIPQQQQQQHHHHHHHNHNLVELLCPVCGEFNASTLTAVNAHIDSCLSQTLTLHPPLFNSNSEPPKKHSIPQLQHQPLKSNHDDDDDDDDGDDDDEEEEEEISDLVCPVCRHFNASTVTAVNAHIDNCLSHAVRDERRRMKRTTKPKPPKKRSIAEILTVAPPLQPTKVKVVQREKDNGRDSCRGASASVSGNKILKKKTNNKGKNKSKMKKRVNSTSDASLNNDNKKRKKKMKKSNSFFNDELTQTNKEEAYMTKVQTHAYSFRKIKSTIGTKMVRLVDIDPCTYKKKLGSKILPQSNKDCDSVEKQLKEASPAHGIVKNNIKQVCEKRSSGSDSEDSSEESDCNDLVPTHVRFICKDDPLSPKKGDSFETMFNKSALVLATSLVKEQWCGSDEETASLNANRNYDHVGIDVEKRNEVSPIVESKQFSHTPEQVSVQDSMKPCINQEESKHCEEKSESLTEVAFCDNDNLHLFDGSNTSIPNCSPYADISRPPSTVEDEQVCGINTDECESGSFSSIGKFIDHLENTTFYVDANTRTFLQPSSSYSASYDQANERPEFPLQTYGDSDNRDQALGDRQLSQLFSADMIDNSFPFTGWGKGSIRTNYSNPNFVGLPLNSQGELINFSLSGKFGTNQPETLSTPRGSSSGLPVSNVLHRRSQENLSINERHVVQKAFLKDGGNQLPHYPAKLVVTALQCKEREDINRPNSDLCSTRYVHPFDSKLNLMRNTHIEQIHQSDRFQNPKGIGSISLKESSDHISPSSSQQTVRLMGKDVPIGRSSEEIQQYDGDVRADEESRRRHYCKFGASENSSLGRSSKQDWASSSPLGISTENVLQSGKIQNHQPSQSNLLMNGPDSEFPYCVSQKGSLAVSRYACSYSHPTTREPNSCAVFKREPDYFPEHYISGGKPLGLSSRSQVLTDNGNFSQLTCLSNGELNDRDGNTHVTKSAFEFPFLQPAVDEQVKTSWSQRPHRTSPSWLSSSTTERRVPVTFTQQVSGASSQSFPRNFWGNNFITPPENPSTECLYPSTPLSSLDPMKTPLCPTPIVQPRHVLLMPLAISNGCRSTNKITDRMKLDDMITKDHRHPCTNTRKRSAISFDDSRKPIKLPNI